MPVWSTARLRAEVPYSKILVRIHRFIAAELALPTQTVAELSIVGPDNTIDRGHPALAQESAKQ